MKVTPTRRIKLNSRLLPCLVGVVLIMRLIDSYRGWSILLAGLGGLWLISYLWARSLVDHLGLVREMRYGWVQVGDQLQERFTLINDGALPALWVEVIDHSTLPVYAASSVRAVGGNSVHRWHLKAICTRRGLFSLGPTSLRTADPAGLYRVEIRLPGWADLLVTPPVIPLPTIVVAPGGRAGQGRLRPNALERIVSAAGVRDYLPGDNLNWIHWPTSAHRDSLYVRRFESTPSSDWYIVLDVNQAVQVGIGQNSTVEHGIILAASLADHGLRSGRAVGLLTNGREIVWRAAQGGDSQRQAVLRNLALTETSDLGLADLLSRAPPSFGRLVSVVIITPDVTGEWLDAILSLMQRGATPTVLLLDPKSFGGAHSPTGTVAALTRLGVSCTVVTRELLDRPELRPGRRGHWEWRVTPTGRVIPIKGPDEADWEALT